MEDREMSMARGIAQGAAGSPIMTDLAMKGLIDFLRREIIDAEWTIARAQASIAAYEGAIKTITERHTMPAPLNDAEQLSGQQP